MVGLQTYSKSVGKKQKSVGNQRQLSCDLVCGRYAPSLLDCKCVGAAKTPRSRKRTPRSRKRTRGGEHQLLSTGEGEESCGEEGEEEGEECGRIRRGEKGEEGEGEECGRKEWRSGGRWVPLGVDVETPEHPPFVPPPASSWFSSGGDWW